MRKKKLPDSFIPFIIFSLIAFATISLYEYSIGYTPAPYIALSIVYLPFAAIEYFKFRNLLYTLVLVGMIGLLGAIWSTFFYRINGGFITYLIIYSVVNTLLLLVFNPICNAKLFSDGFTKMRNMTIEQIKAVLPDKSDAFESEFLTNLTSIEQLKSTKMGSFDQNFEIVEIKNFEEQNWSVMYVNSSFRKTMIVISRHEKKMKFYSIPIEENYNLDMTLYKCLERLN